MKQVYLINASPRQGGSAAALLKSFEQGLTACGDVEVVPVSLYALDYKGCHECFLCRTKGGKSYGHCGYPDAIRGLLDDIAHSDGVVFSTPVYFHSVPGELESFLERLLYPFICYGPGGRSCIAPKKLRSAFLYAMNVTAPEMKEKGYEAHLARMENWVRYVFGFAPEVVYAFNTYQYTDYAKYEAGAWDIAEKTLWRDTQFPVDCASARAAGQRMAFRVGKD